MEKFVPTNKIGAPLFPVTTPTLLFPVTTPTLLFPVATPKIIPLVATPNIIPATPKVITLKVTPNIIHNIETIIDGDGAIVVIIRNWLHTNGLHERLKTLPWIFGKQNMYGKIIDIPRGMFFLGDDNVKVYKYSRLTFPVQPWNSTNPLYQEIEAIRTKISNDPDLLKILGISLQFNVCLLNLYRTGADKIDPHSDKEALGPLNAVVTVSTGGSRSFVLKSKTKGINGRYPKVERILNDGDLVLMAGTCQELWTHNIPISTNQESRISLTYRLIRE